MVRGRVSLERGILGARQGYNYDDANEGPSDRRDAPLLDREEADSGIEYVAYSTAYLRKSGDDITITSSSPRVHTF